MHCKIFRKLKNVKKKAYDAKHCSENQLFKVGIQVFIRNSKKLSRKGSKMEPNWTGPYKICQILKKNTFRLCYVNDCNKKLKQVYNMTRLKIYYPISEYMVLNNIVEKVLNNSEEKSKLSIFTLTMKKVILDGKELTDEHINLAQLIIKKQFPDIIGLQDTLLSQTDAFKAVSTDKISVQIHFINSHWVTSCSINGSILLYDSMYNKLDSHLINQLARCYKNFADYNCEFPPSVVVNIKSVQQQT